MSQMGISTVDASIVSAGAIGRMIETKYLLGGSTVWCQLYYRGIHDTYIVGADNRIFYYKLYSQGMRRLAEIQAEVRLVEHLKAHGIRAVEPVATDDGEYVTQMDVAEGTRYSVLYKAVDGVPWDECPESEDADARLGHYIATMHQAWDALDEPFDRWTLDETSFIDKSLETLRGFGGWQTVDIGFLEEVAEILKARMRETLTRSASAFGMCHGDIYTGNICLDAERNPILYDFDFCGYGWRAYDISMYLNAIGWGIGQEAITRRERRREAFIEGYSRVRDLPVAEVDSITLFAPFRRIFNIGTLYPHCATTIWGYCGAIGNIKGDIELLRDWLRVYPI